MRKIVTADDIAKSLNISRSTVSRAINNNPLVSSETRELVLKTAEKMGFRPNRAARSMVRNREYRFGVVLFSDPPRFWEEVSAGVRRAQDELRDYGVHIEILSADLRKPDEQIALLRKLEDEGAHGIVISPANPADLVDPIDRLCSNGRPVVTLGSDIPESRRICHVGCNYVDSGRIAAQVMGSFVGETGKVAILAFHDIVPAIQQRIVGFRQVMGEYHDVELVGPFRLSRTGEDAYEFVRSYLEMEPELRGIFVSYGILERVARAVKDAGMGHAVRLVGFDLSPEIAAYIRSNIVDAAICQEPFNQGYHSVKTLYRYIVEGQRPRKTIIHTKLEIVMKHNVHYYEDDADYQSLFYGI